MRLIKAKVSGYKRLAEDCELNLDADPVCIVGPNAAGKSSFLDALVHLNDAEPFALTEKTRSAAGQTLEPELEARFVLDDDERELISGIPEAAEVRQWLIYKYDDDSSLRYSADPYPSRDLSRRNEIRAALEKLAELGWVEEAQTVEERSETPPDPLLGALFQAALDWVQSDNGNMKAEAVEVQALAERIGPIIGQILQRSGLQENDEPYQGPDWPDLSDDLLELRTSLAALVAVESETHPLRKLMPILNPRVPQFLKFGDAARTLETSYDLVADEPTAGLGIHYFLALAGTSWGEAVEVIERNDPGWLKTYVEDCDEELKKKASSTWGQSKVEVTISINGSILSILLSMQAHDFIGFDDHSDGLKAFMALRAFIAQEADQEGVKPIVLIDEADLHLHYDAQADLVGVFEEQDEAAQIIYTTHSAGCLPRDLAGVRAIVPQTEEVDGKVVQKDHSEAINRFWTEGRGFSPLLLAMGAGAFAFAATQYAVITEGMSDALLLPTLLREATGKRHLRYQPVPSFAEATADEIKRFDLIAGRIAFLADGDDGGRSHVEKLEENGIASEQVTYIGNDDHSGLSIEDLLVKSVYLKAVNDELGTWHNVEFPADELPEKGRSKAVKDWCLQQTGRNGKPIELSKVDVAQRVLDQRSPETKILAKKAVVKKINDNVLAVFEGAHERMKQKRDEEGKGEVTTVADQEAN